MNRIFLTEKQKSNIYDVLVQMADAPESMRANFLAVFPECREYRFMGRFGFGGKVWFRDTTGECWVSYYTEDENTLRDQLKGQIDIELEIISPAIF